jgi:mevalonate kinase
VPRFAVKGSFVVNCAISPLVSLKSWDYEKRSGLGGSGAWALLNGEDSVDSELKLGVGWQDPAVIQETGLCVWHSGKRPQLHLKRNGNMLKGLMALYFTEYEHDTPSVAEKKRNYKLICRASKIAAHAVLNEDIYKLAEAVRLSHKAQTDEGMNELMESHNCLARKYCGGGWGGYALYLFPSRTDREAFVSHHKQAKAIEPYIRKF